MSETAKESSPAAAPDVSYVQSPPRGALGILRRLGPGMIIAGSIVGSGELIATTKTGAEAGFWLLWLIVIGCVIKVFAQVEFGRYTIVSGKTAMEGMNEVPGPRLRVNWLLWYWLAMFTAGLGQLGGIVGGVGEAMAISVPLTSAGRAFNAAADDKTATEVELARARNAQPTDAAAGDDHAQRIARLEAELEQRTAAADALRAANRDALAWAAIVTAATSVMLAFGRYGFIQTFATVLVAGFTFVTVVNIIALQFNPEWAIQWRDLANGMSFRLPPAGSPSSSPLATALKTFGIIGVGASELVAYPYWCLEKGYARFTGPRDETTAWADRARGWLRVLRWDAWCSMAVYTFATLAFYLLGAAILGRIGLNPSNDDLIRTLTVMYEPVFGRFADVLFLCGAFAVLYSTFFVANAGHGRVFTDALRVVGVLGGDPRRRAMSIRFFSALFPCVCLFIYWQYPKPTTLILFSGLMQAMMLPMLAGATLYFRYRRGDERLRPSRLWDAALWASALGMVVTGGWVAWSELPKIGRAVAGWFA